MFTLAFLRATLERAVKTAAQTAVALAGVNAAGILDVDWAQVASAAALAAVLSVLTSVASSGLTTTPGPSLTRAEVLVPDVPPR